MRPGSTGNLQKETACSRRCPLREQKKGPLQNRSPKRGRLSSPKKVAQSAFFLSIQFMNTKQKQDPCRSDTSATTIWFFTLNTQITGPENAPVRLAGAQASGNLSRSGSSRGGNSAVEPRVKFRIIVYGDRRGICSSWKPEEACRILYSCWRIRRHRITL